jgi:hypothetical protein
MLGLTFTHPNGNTYKVTKEDGQYVRCVKQQDGKGCKGKPSKFSVVEVQSWLNPVNLPYTTTIVEPLSFGVTWNEVVNQETPVDGETLEVTLE